MSNIRLLVFGRAAVDEVKVSAILSGKAQRLLYGSISNSLTDTHTNTNTHTRTHTHSLTHSHRIQNEAAAQNNLPDRLSDTKTQTKKKRKMAIM